MTTRPNDMIFGYKLVISLMYNVNYQKVFKSFKMAAVRIFKNKREKSSTLGAYKITTSSRGPYESESFDNLRQIRTSEKGASY